MRFKQIDMVSSDLSRMQKQILKLSDEHNLCFQLSCLEKNNNKPCFRTQLNKCGGACSQKENKDDYNVRVDLAMIKYQMHVWPYPGPILIEERNSDHKSLKRTILSIIGYT